MRNEFNTSTVENAITSPYHHVAVKWPYEFREIIHDHLSDTQVVNPEIKIVVCIFTNNRLRKII